MMIMSFSSCNERDYDDDKKTIDLSYQNNDSVNEPSDDGSAVASTDSNSVESADSNSVESTDVTQEHPIANDDHSIKTDEVIIELRNNIKALEEKNSLMMESSTVLTLMLIEFLVIILLFIYFLQRIRNKNKKQEDDSYANHSDLHNYARLLVKQNVDDLVKYINKKYNSNDERITIIERKLKKLESKSDPYSGYYPLAKPGGIHSSTAGGRNSLEPKNNPSGTKTFYMPRTMVQMKFEDNKKKYSKSENTYFKFELLSEDVASFTFEPYDDNCFKKAFDDRDNSLATVCEIELYNSQPRKYVNVEPGEAKLINGIWEVSTKLKLRYE